MISSSLSEPAFRVKKISFVVTEPTLRIKLKRSNQCTQIAEICPAGCATDIRSSLKAVRLQTNDFLENFNRIKWDYSESLNNSAEMCKYLDLIRNVRYTPFF